MQRVHFLSKMEIMTNLLFKVAPNFLDRPIGIHLLVLFFFQFRIIVYEHIYCQNYFLIILVFETLHFLKSCPMYDEQNTTYKYVNFWPQFLLFRTQTVNCYIPKVNNSLLYLFYFIISTGLLGLEETYWFCRFEKPRSHLLHEQFAASPLFYQQPTQICLQNAY